MNFLERAQYTIAKGLPVIRLRENSKAPIDNKWPELATTDLNIVSQWSSQSPQANCGAVAQAKIGGFWFWEIDNADVIRRVEIETGKTIPDTFRVRSRPGRGHFYWKQTAASIAAGNISQAYVKSADWSARINSAYVVAPYSLHPHSQQPYEPLREDAIIECPDWLVEWLVSQKLEKKQASEIQKDENNLVPHGSIHNFMLFHAGKLRQMGLGQEAIEVALLQLVHERCAPPINDELVKNMAAAIVKYPVTQTDIILSQQQTSIPAIQEIEDAPTFEDAIYPRFPKYVMEQTSIYENYVKPICEKNSRIDFFMWLTAMSILLNYVGPKIKIKNNGLGIRAFKGSIFQVLIGRPGRTNKSSSVEDSMKYFNYAGILQHNSKDMKNADGKTIVWSAGSPEGLGLEMQRTNCKNAILFYDELSQLVNKAGIDGSSLVSNLLTMYESGKFANTVKSQKEAYSLDPDTYCVSLIACTTDGKFAELWSRMAGSDTGLDDRFMFVLQPEQLPEPKLRTVVNTLLGSIETKKRIDKAIQQGEYGFEDASPLLELVEKNNRLADRAEKWALALAIDLGLDEIDLECVVRAIDIVKYEQDVKRYLRFYEATTREGAIQQEIRRTLEMNQGSLPKRELMRRIHADRHGTTVWNQAYKGLINSTIIREEGQGTRSNPVVVRLLQKREFEET